MSDFEQYLVSGVSVLLDLLSGQKESNMKINGLLKLTLLDYPGKTACTVFTHGCNLRCSFCHNASLVCREDAGSEIPEQEITDFLGKRKKLLDGVCVSGGEPLLQPDIENFLYKIKSEGFLVKLDTNGTFPGKLKQLVSQKLIDYVAMDIKNAPEYYPQTACVEGLDIASIKESVEFLLSDAVDYEFRTTLVKGIHTADSIDKAARFISGAKRYYLQSFVDSGDLIHGKGLSAFTPEEMQEFLKIVTTHVKSAALRGV